MAFSLKNSTRDTAMSTTDYSAEVLQKTTAFLTEVLSQSDHRRRCLFSTFLEKIQSSDDQIPIKPLKLASETLENALSTAHPSIKSSSLRLSEKLLLSYPENPFSSFILSLIYTVFHRPFDAALTLLDVFFSNPSLARLEIAPLLFEELFLIHFLPILEWYNEQRSKILSTSSVNLNSNSNSGYDSDEQSVIVSPSKLLKNMNGNQASGLKDLERDYEEILDENCRLYAKYFKEVLQNKDGNHLNGPPSIVLQIEEGYDKSGHEQEEEEDGKMKRKFSMKNGRYNPIWIEGDQSVELNSIKSRSLSKFPSFLPQRVSPKVLRKQASSRKSSSPPNCNSDPELESFSNGSLSNSSSSDSEVEPEEKNKEMTSFNSRQSQTRKQKEPTFAESSRSPYYLMEDVDNPTGGEKHTPPKDFVCPITTHIFEDPVTLETGQTYERKAIQEWIDRGNSTCPITRQKLHSIQLPKTNYVLKRLIASWQELNLSRVPKEVEKSRREIEPRNKPKFEPVIRSPSLNSVISQATIDGKIYELRVAINNLCTSDVLEDSEMAVLQIQKFWLESRLELDIQNMISRPAVINGFVEILFNSVDLRVLQAAVFLLSELGSTDDSVIQTLTTVDSDVECIVALFRRGLLEAVVLIYQLTPFTMNLVEMDIVDSLLEVLQAREDDLPNMCMKPKAAALLLLSRILDSAEDFQASEIARTVISANAIEDIMERLQSESREERKSAMTILLRCMWDDGRCRNIIADKAELTPILESFRGTTEEEWFEIVRFLAELVKLNRRTFNEQVLHIIKDEGTFSTMHTLLMYLQIAPEEQRPVVAGLLLQLDLLVEHIQSIYCDPKHSLLIAANAELHFKVCQKVPYSPKFIMQEEPRKMSIYREEAIDSLISCLKNSDCPAAQIAAAETILSLQGRFSYSGQPLARAFLLRHADSNGSYKSLKQKHQNGNPIQENSEEEKSAEEWEKRVAFVLVNHEFGLVFEALAEGLRSRNAELYSVCFVVATWLIHMLTILPDTGVKGAARVCLLKQFVWIFKSSKDKEDKALSILALNSFISDSEGLRDLSAHIKDILRGLRELKRSCALAFQMLKVLSEEHESSADLWNHKELLQEDCSTHGEVLSITCFKDKIFSGHSDGTIKVWTRKGGNLLLIQESQEHTKAVTSLAILPSPERLYSGSLDRTVRVWSIDSKVMHCEKVHEMKDHVNNLVISNSLSCFIPQGIGVKVHSWNGASRLLNPNKYVKCLTLVQGKLYCGCLDNSIQEIDLTTGTQTTIQNGSRKLLAKGSPVYAIQVCDGLIYSASPSFDGATVKIWSTASYRMVGSLPCTSEVRAMAASSDLIYLGCKGGIVEVWCKKKHNKVETLQTGTNAKVLSMAVSGNEDVLVIGTSDGKIQAWGLS